MARMSIQNVETKKLKKMLRMKNFQDKDSQKMIKDEIKFRKEGMSLEEMTKVFKKGSPFTGTLDTHLGHGMNIWADKITGDTLVYTPKEINLVKKINVLR